jgi:NADH-quinone oxidoreductase subunit L
MQHFVWGILLLPLVGFVANALGTRFNNRTVSLVGPGSVGLAFVCAVVAFAWLQGQPASARSYDEIGWTWAIAGAFHLKFGLLLDPLSSLMTFVVTGVGFLILVYSVSYMAGEEGYRRFFAQMNLFIFTMLLLVLADNYLWLLVGWGGVGLTSYLLIGFYYERPSAVSAARKAFVMNVIGDWGIMIAIFLMFLHFGAVDYGTVLSQAHTLPYNGQVATLICLLLLLGAVAKSAQIPLHTWLPDAMEGPTPVSALIHAATMVTAGVYLIARSYPLYQQSPYGLHTVAFIGGIGTVFAAGMGLANNDIKRVLAYSTMSQIAYMFVGVGVAVYSAGMFHLLEHAFFKALLFMCAGAVMHAMRDELNIQRMGGLRNKMPFTYAMFVIGFLAIIGTPLFSGFFSKEDVIGAAYARALHGDGWLWIVWGLAVVASGLTALYMFRLLYLVFHGEPRDRELYEHAHEPSLPMRVPMLILGVLSVVGGYIALPGVYNELEAWLAPVFTRFPVAGPRIEAQPFYWESMAVTLAVTALGLVAGWTVYARRSPAPGAVAATAPGVYRVFANRYYVDQLYEFLFVRPVKWFSRVLDRYVEQDVIDFAVDGTGKLIRVTSARLRVIQTGFVRNYALGILFGAVLVVGYYVVGGR